MQRVEKVRDARRLGHSRDHESGAEQRAGERSDRERGYARPSMYRGRHDSLPAIIAVIAPVIMNVATAISERPDHRESPHTP
jgi:hypothetical protein